MHHDACHATWVADRVSEHQIKRINPRTVVNELAAALRPRYDEVLTLDGPGDGGVDLALVRWPLRVLVQVKHWRQPMASAHVMEAVRKIETNYDLEPPCQVWVVNLSWFRFRESLLEIGLPLKKWKIQDLLRACKPRKMPDRVPRDRHLRLRNIQGAGRRKP